jgi:hypothetical protein
MENTISLEKRVADLEARTDAMERLINSKSVHALAEEVESIIVQNLNDGAEGIDYGM